MRLHHHFRFWVQVCKAELLCRRGWFKKTIHAWNDKSFVISRRSFAFWFDLCLPRMFAQWMITTTLLRFIKYARVVELSFSFPNYSKMRWWNYNFTFSDYHGMNLLGSVRSGNNGVVSLFVFLSVCLSLSLSLCLHRAASQNYWPNLYKTHQKWSP